MNEKCSYFIYLLSFLSFVSISFFYSWLKERRKKTKTILKKWGNEWNKRAKQKTQKMRPKYNDTTLDISGGKINYRKVSSVNHLNRLRPNNFFLIIPNFSHSPTSFSSFRIFIAYIFTLLCNFLEILFCFFCRFLSIY